MIEAMCDTADLVQQRHAVLDLLDVRSGEDILDVGSGPGDLACGVAQRVGPRGSVHGVEPGESMPATAARRSAGEHSATLRFGAGEALARKLPGGGG